MLKTLFDSALDVYRNTFKRVPGLHRACYWMGETVILPLIESVARFKTVKDDPLNFRLKLILGRHEPETVAWFKGNIRAGMVVLDIGAHCGYYTRLFANLVGPKGRVVALEPHPLTFQYLKQNVERLPNVVLRNVAAGERSGTARIYDGFVDSGSATLAVSAAKREFERTMLTGELNKRARAGLPVVAHEVRVARVDELVRDCGVERVDVVKMDIEGAEVYALRGMAETLRSNSCVLVFEFAPSNLAGFGFKPADLFKTLTDLGYSKYGVITRDGASVVEELDLWGLIEKLEEKFGYVNMVAWKA